MQGLLKSRKFIYALTTLIVSVIYALIPYALNLSAESYAMLADWMPVTASVIVMAVFGHILQDYTVTKGKITIKPVAEAASDVIGASQSDDA